MRQLIAGGVVEFVGTFALVFVGGAAILHDPSSLLNIALAHALVLGVMVSACMHVSGAQFNPAVSIALVMIRKQSVSHAAVYIAVQLVAAVAAALLLKGVFSPEAVEAGRLGATLGSLSGAGDEPARIGMLFLLEVIATCFLMFVILGTVVDQRGVGRLVTVGGFGIGFVVAACVLCFGPLTGASMNPARSFGPALAGGYWASHWIYWAAPVVGAAVTALVWDALVDGPDQRLADAEHLAELGDR